MKTIYVDVYFLINFTVDLLALHFASRFSKVPIRNIRLILSALIGGFYAVGSVFVGDNKILQILTFLVSLFLITVTSATGVGLFRKIKFVISFITVQFLIGGITYFGFVFLDRFFDFNESADGVEKRSLLLFSFVILFAIGIIKLLFAFFSGSDSEKFVNVRINLLGESIQCAALVDSGNLVRDPIDFTPVLFLKRATAEKLFSTGIPEFNEGKIPERYKKNVRLIPINRGEVNEILYGIRPDGVYVLQKNKEERIKVTIVLDKEGGTYGGYEALMPASALENL